MIHLMALIRIPVLIQFTKCLVDLSGKSDRYFFTFVPAIDEFPDQLSVAMSLQILIADDDPDDLEMLEEALNEAHPGLLVDKADGGKAAVKMLGAYDDNSLPDLIILDFNMPDLPGSEVLAYIQGQRRYDNIPRVVFSTSDSQRHVSEAMGKGATGYFVKASSKKELDQVTAKMLALAKPE